MTPRIVSVQGVKTPPHVPNPAVELPFIELSLVRESKLVWGVRQEAEEASDYTKPQRGSRRTGQPISQQIPGLNLWFQFFHVLVSNVFCQLFTFVSTKRNDRTDGSTFR